MATSNQMVLSGAGNMNGHNQPDGSVICRGPMATRMATINQMVVLHMQGSGIFNMNGHNQIVLHMQGFDIFNMNARMVTVNQMVLPYAGVWQHDGHNRWLFCHMQGSGNMNGHNQPDGSVVCRGLVT